MAFTRMHRQGQLCYLTSMANYERNCYAMAAATEYGHTKAKSLILWPKFKFKSQFQINIWDMDIKANFM